MKLILSYIDRRGGHTTMPIKTIDVERKLKWCCKNRYEAELRDADNWEDEYGWVYKHDEAGWTWGYDTDIMKEELQINI